MNDEQQPPAWNFVQQSGIRKKRHKYRRVPLDNKTTVEGPFGVIRWDLSPPPEYHGKKEQQQTVCEPAVNAQPISHNTGAEPTVKRKERTSIKIQELLNSPEDLDDYFYKRTIRDCRIDLLFSRDTTNAQTPNISEKNKTVQSGTSTAPQLPVNT
jgi:hypothetical protein